MVFDGGGGEFLGRRGKGLGMMVTGYDSGDYTLAYTGAALALTSLGYHSDHWFRKERTDHRFEKVSGLEAKVQEPDTDKALYVRRTHQRHQNSDHFTGKYDPLTEPNPRKPHKYSILGSVRLSAAGVLALLGLLGHGDPFSPATYFYTAGATTLATLAHYVGFIFGKKRAKPEYKKVSGLEKKVEEKD